MDERIVVSIICNAYNHEIYIRDALESFVMQKTNFKFEILVHDDASTDKTADVIREYEAKYPDLIKPIYQTENQYSKGTGIVGKIQRGRVLGKYIAFCEGDDYWTDTYKLQKQYDALEAHPEVDICAHCGMKVNAETKECIGYISPAETDSILTIEQVIMGGGGYVATNSLMYRRNLDFNFPKFREYLRLDYSLQIHGALRGGMLYLAECMSAYRVMSKSSWSSTTYSNKVKYQKHIEKLVNMLNILDEETGYIYKDVIQTQIKKQEFGCMLITENYENIKNLKYNDLYKGMNAKQKMYINIKLYFPWVLKMWNKIKGR